MIAEDWREWPVVIEPGSRPVPIDREPKWTSPANYRVANEPRYMLVETAIANVRDGGVLWANDARPYRVPLVVRTHRGYYTRITREGLALWPTFARPPELGADPFEHPCPCVPGRRGGA